MQSGDVAQLRLRSAALFRFLHRQYTPWERAERLDVRSFVEWLLQAPNPQRIRRRPPRLEEMTCNAEARLAEAQDRAWLGEVAAPEESLKHLRQRRVEAATRLAVDLPG